MISQRCSVRAPGHILAARTNVPVIIHFMLVHKRHEITVNVNYILAAQGHAVTDLILLTDSFGKKPVQNRKVNVNGLKLPAVEPQVLFVQAVLEFVELGEPAVTERESKVSST